MHALPGFAARAADARPALLLRGRRVGYADLHRSVARAAAWLAARGARHGDRILLQLDRGLPFVALHLACLRDGLISTPCSPAATAAEAAHIAADSGARLHLRSADVAELEDAGFDGTAPAAHAELPAAAPGGDTPAALVYTSGTTGRPKGVLLTHGNLRANTETLHAAWGWSERDVLLHVLPLFHVHGLFVALHGALHAGATTVLLDGFQASAVVAGLREHGATLLMGVPTMYHRLAQLPRGPGEAAAAVLPALRLCVCGSAPLRPETAAAFRARFGHDLLQRYGLTEALMLSSQRLHGKRTAESVGRALPGVELRIVDLRTRAALGPGAVGEVLARGPGVFAGYWQRPDLTAQVLDAEGWIATGDLGCLDADGELHLAGRARELIISGGFNVSPREVERVLEAHPWVQEAAVFGLPDEDLGERVAAAVVLHAGAPAEPAALLAHCRGQLAPYKAPRVLALLDALPRSAMGKVQKAQLAERAEFRNG